MNDFLSEQVITGADLLRGHYSLNDMVKDDHLLFINSLLTTIGAEVGVLFTFYCPERKKDFYWSNVTLIDKINNSNFEQMMKNLPHILIENMDGHYSFTFFDKTWSEKKGGFICKELSPDDNRITLVNGIINSLRSDIGLGTNALRRGLNAMRLAAQKDTPTGIPYCGKAPSSNLVDYVDQIVGQVLSELYNNYQDSYLLQPLDKKTKRYLRAKKKRDLVQPLFFARQVPINKKRFCHRKGFSYGIRLLLTERQFLTAKLTEPMRNAFQSDYENERSILDTTFSLGVVHRADITQDDDSYQWPRGFQPSTTARRIKNYRNKISTQIFEQMVGEKANGIQMTSHPIFWFGCPFCSVVLVHPVQDGDFSRTTPSLWRQRYLFYSDFIVARVARKFRAMMLDQTLKLIDKQTRGIMRQCIDPDISFVSNMGEFLDQLACLMPIPQIDVTEFKSDSIGEYDDNGLNAPTHIETIIEYGLTKYMKLSRREKPTWTSGFSKIMDTPRIDQRFINRVGQTIQNAVRKEIHTNYNRYYHYGGSRDSETALYLIGQLGQRLFKPDQMHRFVILEGEETIPGPRMEDVAQVLASAIRKNNVDPPLRCDLGYSRSFWDMAPQLLTFDELSSIVGNEEFGLKRFCKENPDYDFGKWARYNPYGSVVALMHGCSDANPSVNKRLNFLLNIFNATNVGSLVLTVQNRKWVQTGNNKVKVVRMIELREIAIKENRIRDVQI